MVEAPRIRIIYERVKFTDMMLITAASGASYNKIGINLIGYTIIKWWFAGKYLYTYLTRDDCTPYVIRTHTMMYGKIIVNNEPMVNPRLQAFLLLELNNYTTLTWYLTQIKILDPTCESDQVQCNYTICCSKQNIDESMTMMKYDISHQFYDKKIHWKHLLHGLKKHGDDIVTDFLLDQAYFPGVGNILQQEALYRSGILPMRKLSNITTSELRLLVKDLAAVIAALYESYKRKLEAKPHLPQQGPSPASGHPTERTCPYSKFIIKNFVH